MLTSGRAPSVGVDRRTFLRQAGTAAGLGGSGLTGILAGRRPPAFAQGTRLHVLHWADFVPEGDVELKRQAAEAGKLFGADVRVENINANDLQARITAAVKSGAGPDIIEMLHNWPHLYQSTLVDVSEVAEGQGKDQGGFYEQAEAAARLGKRWLAVPYNIVGVQFAYRKSWFDEVGHGVPRTYADLRQAGTKLKQKGRPVGQTLGHTFGDAPGFTYCLLWAFGGAETDAAGKTVLNSKATVESVKFMQAFWRDACDEGGLAWDDTNNNRAFHAGEICATLNGASIYLTAKRQADKIKDERGEPLWHDIQHFPHPVGPGGGAVPYHVTFSHAVMKYGKNQKLAKDFLKWLHGKEQFGKWLEVEGGFSVGPARFWENHPMWAKVDEAMKGYRTAARGSRMFGYAGPSNARATEVFSKYIVTDMYAKAVQGTKAEDAVAWAAGEMKKIYG